jgi:hypothetical protein
MKRAIGCLCELKNARNIIDREPEKENTGQKQNATEPTQKANKTQLSV